jgi:hypothetical protein
MFERHATNISCRARNTYRRVAHHAMLGVVVLVCSLGIGMIGYHAFEKMSWVDAFVNAAMILSGMGPVATLQTDGGKIFAGCYALYSGITLIGILGNHLCARSSIASCTNFIWRTGNSTKNICGLRTGAPGS